MTTSIDVSQILEYGQTDFSTEAVARRYSVNSPICFATSYGSFKDVSRYGCTSNLTDIKELK